MSIVDLSLIGIALLCLFISFWVYFRNPNNIVNSSFSFFTFTGALWPLSIAFFRISHTPEMLFFYAQLIYICGTLVPIAFLLFVFAYTQRKALSGIFSILLCAFPALFIPLLFFSGSWIVDARITNWGNTIDLGPVYPLWIVYFGTYMGWGTYLLFKKYHHSSGLEKAQLGYMLLAILFPLAGAFPFNIIFPIFGDFRFIFLGPFFLTAMMGIIAYAIIHHRLFDIHYALQLVTTHVVISVASAGLFISIMVMYWSIKGEPIDRGLMLIVILAVLIFISVLGKVQSLGHDVMNKYFFHTYSTYQQTLKELSDNLSSYLEMPMLTDVIISSLMKSMNVNRVAVLVKDYLTDHYKIQKTVGFNESNGISLVRDNFLTSHLESSKKIIVLEEIQVLILESQSEYEKGKLSELSEHMKKIEADLLLPIINAGRLTSLIVLGSKNSGNPFTTQDIELLTTIANQAGIAIENARLYKELSLLNRELQERVDKATGELRKRNVDLEKANVELKSLDRMKDQLIAVTSHELRTPASIVQNYLWMVLHRPSPGTELSSHDRTELSRALSAIQNLIKIVKSILDVSHIEGGKLSVRIQSVDVNEVIDSVIEELIRHAREKGLYLVFQKKEGVRPFVSADPLRFREVMANLVSNAVKYTAVGGITIDTEADGRKLVIRVSDTGRGIAPEHLPHLFQKFYREDASLTANTLETGGTGLGLFIAKSLMTLMHGDIRAESTKDHGTTFTLRLPLTAPLNQAQSLPLPRPRPGRISIPS